MGALPERGSGAARDGFADSGGWIRNGCGGFERCCAENCAVCAAECVVSVSARGGRYADDFDGAGAGGECEDVRVAGAAARGAAGGVERGGEQPRWVRFFAGFDGTAVSRV